VPIAPFRIPLAMLCISALSSCTPKPQTTVASAPATIDSTLAEERPTPPPAEPTPLPAPAEAVPAPNAADAPVAEDTLSDASAGAAAVPPDGSAESTATTSSGPGASMAEPPDVTAAPPVDTTDRHERRERATAARPAAREPANDSTGVVLIPVYFATSRSRTGHAPPNGVFGADREHGPLHYGVATISIPPGHRPGELERPGRILFVIHRSENPSKHVVIASLDTLDADGWLRRVQHDVDGTEEKEILVYVHGYNVPFDDAMRRAGQLGYDLGYENGTVAAFSWPSRGSAAEYAADAANAEWTGPALERFLTRLADSAGAQRIAVVVHSMGNRAMASVLRSLANRAQPAFTELVLAAPDLDADVFQEQIAPILGKAARHSTLYVSSGDRALGISTRLHEQLRAGLGGARMFGLQELDVVDASSVPAGALDHSYYAENKEVLDDLFMLVRRGLPAERRNLRKYPQYEHAWRLP
jgi:esterase/lipase superfamily enzyme